jgi:hypothetical protein
MPEFITLIITNSLAFITGFLTILTDLGEARSTKLKIQRFIAFMSVIGAMYSCYSGYEKIQKDGKKDTETAGFQKNVQSSCNKLDENGKNENEDTKNNMIKACLRLSEIFVNSSFQQTNQDEKTKVIWYRKTKDNLGIASFLTPLGLDIELGDNSKKNVSEVNAIWFGKDVNINDVKAVAYTVIASGAELKSIKGFHSNDKKNTLIELGGDDTCKDEYRQKNKLQPIQPILASQIDATNKFEDKKKGNEPCKGL